MSNGRAFDEDIAEVVVQAAHDGVISYDEIVKVVRAQAPLREEEAREQGAGEEEIERERWRWGRFQKSSITAWKRRNPEFEAALMAAEEQAALEQIPEILKLGELAMAIGENRGLEGEERMSTAERKTRLKALDMKMKSQMWAVTMRLSKRKRFNEAAPGPPPATLPRMPANPRFQLGPRPEGGSDVN